MPARCAAAFRMCQLVRAKPCSGLLKVNTGQSVIRPQSEKRQEIIGHSGICLVLTFGQLEIKFGSLAVDEHRAGIYELLSCTVVTGKTAHNAERQEVLDRQRTGTIGNMYDTAETNAVEIWFSRKIVQHRSHQACDVLVEGQRRQLIARGSVGCAELGRDRELQVRALTKSNETGRCIVQKARLLVESPGSCRESRHRSGALTSGRLPI